MVARQRHASIYDTAKQTYDMLQSELREFGVRLPRHAWCSQSDDRDHVVGLCRGELSPYFRTAKNRRLLLCLLAHITLNVHMRLTRKSQRITCYTTTPLYNYHHTV